jgi:hypothetical protein
MAGFRLLQLMPGMGPKSAQKILDTIGSHADPLAALEQQQPPGASAAVYLALLATLQASRGLPWPDEIAGTSRICHVYMTTIRADCKISSSSSVLRPATPHASAF